MNLIIYNQSFLATARKIEGHFPIGLRYSLGSRNGSDVPGFFALNKYTHPHGYEYQEGKIGRKEKLANNIEKNLNEERISLRFCRTFFGVSSFRRRPHQDDTGMTLGQ